MAGCRHVVGIQSRLTEEVEGPQPWMPRTCSPPERWDGRGQAVSPAGPEVSLRASRGDQLWPSHCSQSYSPAEERREGQATPEEPRQGLQEAQR